MLSFTGVAEKRKEKKKGRKPKENNNETKKIEKPGIQRSEKETN
jgi:hypothetical protein